MNIDRRIQLIAQIPYTNPFTRERVELEKGILGKEYQDPSANPGARRSDLQSNTNLANIIKIAYAWAEKARVALYKGEIQTQEAFTIYEDITFLITYYELAAKMDEHIAKSHRRPAQPTRITFYREFQERSTYYLEGTASAGFQRSQSESRLFSIYYQIRRAYYHIFENFVGNSKVVTELRADVWRSIFTHNIRRYARSLAGKLNDSVTLITGPSGTGKELVARAIGLSQYIPFDEDSLEFEENFMADYFPINLAALSPTLIESELFGHRKGSFTGAQGEHKGYFESCGDYGTVFLDEIGEIDELTQVKLLRLLQTRRFQRLGDTRELSFNGKLIAATNRNLEEAIEAGAFREDFYFRLCSDQIRTPSLQEMLADSTGERDYLMGRIAEKLVGAEEAESLAREVTDWAKRHLPLHYRWPGNFRELEQCVRNVLIRGHYGFVKNPMLKSSSASGSLDELMQAQYSAEQLLDQYASAIYERHQSIQVVSDILKVDRRTARKHILQLRQNVQK